MRGIQYAAASRFNHGCLWNTGSPAGACHPAGQWPDRVAGHDKLCECQTAQHRHCERSEAIQGSTKQVWIASSRSLSSGAHSRDPLAPRNDVEPQLRDLAARCARVFAINLSPSHQRAQGMPGARRARSLACKNKKAHEQVTTVTPKTPGIPRAMVLTVSFALSRVTGLVCHPRPRKLPSADLTPASGRQDHTTSPSALSAPRRCALWASTASRPASVTIASRPSSETGRWGI
jgi:hypothetical protein